MIEMWKDIKNDVKMRKLAVFSITADILIEIIRFLMYIIVGESFGSFLIYCQLSLKGVL